MNTSNILTIVIIITLSIISGIADAYGFTHAAKVWKNDKIVINEIIKSALGFAIGISIYWIIIRFMNQIGIQTALLQTTIWFTATIIGVAILTGNFATWTMTNKIIAILVIMGLCWLITHEG